MTIVTVEDANLILIDEVLSGVRVTDRSMTPEPDRPPSRRRELLTFLILAFGIWPIVAVGVVGGYGFLVWMYQILTGPPGPMGH